MHLIFIHWNMSRQYSAVSGVTFKSGGASAMSLSLSRWLDAVGMVLVKAD